MTRRAQQRLVFHGALFMVVAMSAGTPGFYIAIHQEWTQYLRQYFRQAHSILISTGIWMIATGAALPSLELTERGIAALVWSLIVSGYTFLVALGVLGLAFLLKRPTLPKQWDQLMATPYHLGWVYVTLISLSGAASFLAGAATVFGTYKALHRSPLDAIH